MLTAVFIYKRGFVLCRDFLRGKLWTRTQRTKYFTRGRGMSVWRDHVDWVGGYPFEVAKPEVIIDHFHQQGFQLKKIKTCGGGHGCNVYVFKNKAS